MSNNSSTFVEQSFNQPTTFDMLDHLNVFDITEQLSRRSVRSVELESLVHGVGGEAKGKKSNTFGLSVFRLNGLPE